MDATRWAAGSLGIFCCLTAGCGIDDRLLTLRGIVAGTDAGLDAGRAPGEQLAPRLEVTPESLDLGRVTTGFPARARVLVSNTGSAPLAAPRIDWAPGSSADLQIIQNQCERDVAPGERCEVRVQVVPSQPGAITGTLQVESAVGSVGVAVAALGMAAGDLVLAPLTGSFEDYGGVLIGAQQEGTFTLSNPSTAGTGVLELGVNRPEFAFVSPDASDCVPGTTALAQGESCNVRLAFAPAERGSIDAVLTIASAEAGSVSLTLAGRGLLPGVVQTSTPALDFEDVLVGQSAKRAVTFANGGDEPVELASASLAPEGVEGFTIQDSDCNPGTALEGGKSCNVQLEFRPPRAGEELTAQLLIGSAGSEQPLAVAVRGVGLLPGSLEIASANADEPSFGDVLVGESAELTFELSNPGAQPSGVLEVTASEGFELVTPPVEGDCQPGTTSLVDGQRCNVRVRFSPTEREAADGALTVTSPLSGAVGLPLSGRGIIAGQIEAPPEANFGRVLRDASAERTLKLSNTGDQPLAPPTIVVEANDDAQKAAFTVEPGCTEPVEVGAECELKVTFAPKVAVPHAASLDITSGSSTASVLLLGEALVPGSLVIAPAPDSSPAFGDVEIDTTVTKSFTLTNPGAEPSGPVTITTDDNQFAAAPGDCNQGDPAGLVDGASCTFSVAFKPTGSQAAAANVSVQSPGAGRAGLAVSGRGRVKAALAGAGTRDFGRAVIGAAQPTVAENEFTWTVSNTGDLPTGALVVSNDDPMEFVVGRDECTGVAVAGKASCQLAIRFRPGETARRSGSITARDPQGMSSAVLAMSGTGVRLAAPGQSCRDADCESGECTRPALVCCDRACVTCEECSPEGTCVPQDPGSPCGDPASGSQCFGANACKLPSGSRCSADGATGDAQCGRGHCELRLGGSGASDRTCCDVECPDGFACNAQGTGCEQPAIGAGQPCDPAASRCGDGLDCKRCRGTARDECTPRGQCCGDCGSGFECFGGECQCADENGNQGLDCGPGVCAIVRDGACCPQGNPGCAANQVCDFSDHLCKECADDSSCVDPAKPFCDLGAHVCRQCLGNDGCAGSAAGPICDLSDHQCKVCVGNGDCAGNPAGAVCDPSDHQCKECVGNGDCAGNPAGAVCDSADHRCKGCVGNGDCAGNPAGAVCDLSDNQCKGCVGNGDCAGNPAGPTCDLSDHQCKGCAGDGDCVGNPAGAICDEASKVCVECRDQFDCTDPIVGRVPSCGADHRCVYDCDPLAFKPCDGGCITLAECCPACPGGQTCVDAVCQDACSEGAAICADGDRQTCSGGVFVPDPCPGGTTCDGGTCRELCTDGTSVCGGDNNDRQTCSGGSFASDPCPGGTTCEDGTCAPTAGNPCGEGGRCNITSSCATNGICCTAFCTGACEACSADGSSCDPLQPDLRCTASDGQSGTCIDDGAGRTFCQIPAPIPDFPVDEGVEVDVDGDGIPDGVDLDGDGLPD